MALSLTVNGDRPFSLALQQVMVDKVPSGGARR